MSRSRRKSPFMGVTTARSEKWDKQTANRRLRKHVNQILAVTDCFDVDYEFDLELPVLREVSCVWCFAKDGKAEIDLEGEDAWRLMRK